MPTTGLTAEVITKLLQPQKRPAVYEPSKYIRRMTEFTSPGGFFPPEYILESDLYDPPPPKPSREDRLERVMRERYGVPLDLIVAYRKEVKDYGDYY